MQKALPVGLWIVQVLLAASMLWASWMKLFTPVEELSHMWPWAGEVPVAVVKLTGIVDLLGALGLVLPGLFRMRTELTVTAALGIVMLMICASIFHILRGEAAVIGVNVVFAMMAAFIFWGRRKLNARGAR